MIEYILEKHVIFAITNVVFYKNKLYWNLISIFPGILIYIYILHILFYSFYECNFQKPYGYKKVF